VNTEVPRKFSEAKTNIIQGMQDGGAIAPHLLEGIVNRQTQDPDPSTGLAAVAKIVAAGGEPVLQALKLGLVSARQKYGQILQQQAAPQPFGAFPGTAPSFEDLLREEVGRAWAAIGQPKQPQATTNPTPPMGTPTPQPMQ
jgi:hypothetical protein